MAIIMTGKKGRIELLAPAGKWDVLEAVIEAGADAVYLGGKNYNMRLHRKDFNFSREELRDAVQFAHSNNVRVYIAVNNLLTNSETEAIEGYLSYLQEIGADALIIQDIGLIRLAKELQLRLPLHASVMMNAHNLEGILFLQELGIKRIILPREISLAEIKYIRSQVSLELEYFVHGDMCFSQTSQCYLSGMLFGLSSNRGRCLKPCRWEFFLIDRDTAAVEANSKGNYILALKDLCLLPFLPEIADAGICSIKIEGRMREAGYLKALTGFYRRALDSYYADPFGYRTDWEEVKKLESMRVRDLTPLYAFGNPGQEAIGYSGEREPQFFSRAAKIPVIEEKDIHTARLSKPEAGGTTKPLLSVKVGSVDAALAAIENGADIIYTSGEIFSGSGNSWRPENLREIIEVGKKRSCLTVPGMPRIIMPGEMGRVLSFIEIVQDLEPEGILVTNLGAVYAAYQSTGLPLYADYSCNITNREAALLLKSYRVKQITASIEFCYEEILSLLKKLPVALEIIVHGQLPVIITEHCIPAAIKGTTKYKICKGLCQGKRYGLLDKEGQIYPLELDSNCRNHIFLARELALLPFLPSFYGSGIKSLRLEIPTYSSDEAAIVTRIYRRNIDRLWENPDQYHLPEVEWEALLSLERGPYTAVNYTNGVRVSKES